MAELQPVKRQEVESEIERQYVARLPRVGRELDAFVQDQAEYFGISERMVRRIVGHAQNAQISQFSAGIQTATQRIADVMGITRVEILETVRAGMRANRERVVLDRQGRPVLHDNGKPVIVETTDWASRLAAADKAAKLIGAYAPKEVRIEASHEHTHTITDAELARDLAKFLGGVGLQVVDADFESITWPETAGREITAGAQDPDGGEESVRLADEPDADD